MFKLYKPSYETGERIKEILLIRAVLLTSILTITLFTIIRPTDSGENYKKETISSKITLEKTESLAEGMKEMF